MTTWDCSVCKHVNGRYRNHCSICGTVPAILSINGNTFRYQDGTDIDRKSYLPTVAAKGLARVVTAR